MTRTTDRIATLTTLALVLSGLLVACGGPDSILEGSEAVALAKPTDTGMPSDPGTPADAGSTPTSAATPTDAGAPTEPAPTASVPSVKMNFAAVLPDGAFKPLKRAQIRSTAAVWVVADWTGVTADESERLTLWSPSGTVYYATEIPCTDGATSLFSSWTLADGTRRVAFKLLIWGTSIESFDDVGTWTATAELLDGSTTASATLELK
jgi:hypothetical protein